MHTIANDRCTRCLTLVEIFTRTLHY